MTCRQRYLGAPAACHCCLFENKLSLNSAAPAGKGRCLPVQQFVLPVCAGFMYVREFIFE